VISNDESKSEFNGDEEEQEADKHNDENSEEDGTKTTRGREEP
jgi:hypothetical protein